MRDLGTTAISVGTFSKPFGLPGLRIGWIAATKELIRRCWSTRDYISLAPARLSDALADIALQLRDPIVARNHDIIGKNLDTADRWFAENADLVSWTRPRAGLWRSSTTTSTSPRSTCRTNSRKSSASCSLPVRHSVSRDISGSGSVRKRTSSRRG